jgi:hypothetical protein
MRWTNWTRRLVIATASPAARRTPLHMRPPRASCGIISVWSQAGKNLLPSNRHLAGCGDSARCAARISLPIAPISHMSCFVSRRLMTIRRSGRSCTSGPRMMCHGSSRGIICHVLPSGRRGVDIEAYRRGCIRMMAGCRELSRLRANLARPCACRMAIATDMPDGTWPLRGSRAFLCRS